MWWRRLLSGAPGLLLATTLYVGLLPSIEVNESMCEVTVHAAMSIQSTWTESVCTHPTPRTAGTRLPDPQLCRRAGPLLLDGRVQLGAFCSKLCPC